jgi:predicted tellurium resistance membrane protein TerC
VKKYIIRIIGALCILGAITLLFMSPFMEITGVKRADMREFREDTEKLLEGVSQTIQDRVSYDEDFEDDLKDNNFPSKKSAIKKRFKEVEELATELLNDKISIHELAVISAKAPGIVKDVGNLLNTKGGDYVINAITQNAMEQVREENPDAYFGDEEIREYKKNMQADAEDAVALLSALSIAFIGLAVLLALIVLLAVISAVTHVCNKKRGLKYVVLVIMLILVIGGTVAGPLVSNLVELQKPFDDAGLQMAIMPYVALALMFVPIVLDIIFERKNKNSNGAEEENAVCYEETAAPSVEMALPEEPAAPTEEQTAADVQETEEVFPEDEVTETVEMPEEPKKKKKGLKFWLITGISAAVAIAATVLVLVLFVFNTYKTPIKLMEKSANAKKASAVLDRRIEMLNGFCEDEYKEIAKIMKKSDNYEDTLEYYEESIDYNKDEYGSNYKIKYKIVDKEKLDKDELREVRDSIREDGERQLEDWQDMDDEDYEEAAEELGITKSQAKKYYKERESVAKTLKKAKVTEGYVLTVSVTITGSELDEPEEDEYEISVYKVNGRWVSSGALSMLLYYNYVL